MQTEIETYLDTLCGQIRWKKARRLVREELIGHIEENMNEGVSKGMSKSAAEIKAAQAMGNPVEVGKMMDRLHRPKTDILFVISIAVLMLFGLAVQTAALYPYRPEWIVFRVIGLALFVLCIFINFRWLLKKSIFIIASGGLGIAGLLFMNLTSAQHHLWKIPNDWLAFINYICICLFVLSFSGLLSRMQKRNRIAVLAAAGAAIAAISMLLFRDLAPRILAVFLLPSLVVMFWFTNIKTLWKIIVSAAIASLVVIYFILNPVVFNVLLHPERMSMFFDDETVMLKEHLLNVQIIGQTPGVTRVSFNNLYLASVNIMAYVLLKFGILPAALLLAALGVLIWRMISACIRIRDTQGRVLAAGLAMFITIAAIGTLLLNIMFIGTSGTYMPFLQGIGPEFVLYSVFTGLIAGLYRRKEIYAIKDTLPCDSGTPADAETA